MNSMSLKSSKHTTIQIIQPSKKLKINLMDQEKNRNSQHLIMMMYHLAANGMEIITVVHMMPYLQIWQSNPKKWKKNFKDSNEYLSTLHDGFQRYLRGVSTLE